MKNNVSVTLKLDRILMVEHLLIAYSNLCISLFLSTAVLIIMDNNFKVSLQSVMVKQLQLVDLHASHCQSSALPSYVFIFIAYCKAYQKRQSRTETLRFSGYLSKSCLSARGFAMHDFQLERGDVYSRSFHTVIQAFIFF